MEAGKNKTEKTNKILYVYNSKCKLIKKTDYYNLSKELKVSIDSIKSAVNSFKGYGYVKNCFVANKTINRFYTSDEVMEMFGEWCNNNLNKNRTKLKKMFGKDYREDYFNDALLYICNAIMSERSINDFESALIFKYKTSAIDEQRVMKAREDVGMERDIIYTNEEGKEYSYIQDMASEDDYFWTDKKYNCNDDINDANRIDLIGYKLKEVFNSEKVDLFIAILTSEFYEFIDIREKPEVKYFTLVRRLKEQVKDAKSVETNAELKKLSDTRYMMEVFDECWNKMLEIMELIKIEASAYELRGLDDYTLNDLYAKPCYNDSDIFNR